MCTKFKNAQIRLLAGMNSCKSKTLILISHMTNGQHNHHHQQLTITFISNKKQE